MTGYEVRPSCKLLDKAINYSYVILYPPETLAHQVIKSTSPSLTSKFPMNSMKSPFCWLISAVSHGFPWVSPWFPSRFRQASRPAPVHTAGASEDRRPQDLGRRADRAAGPRTHPAQADLEWEWETEWEL